MPLKAIYIEEKNLPAIKKAIETAIYTGGDGSAYWTDAEEQAMESVKGQLTGLVDTPFITDLVYASLEKQYKEEHTNRYTETTIPEPGWYFWYPSNTQKGWSNPRFIHLLDMEDLPGLNCKAYAGTYIGPFTIPRE